MDTFDVCGNDRACVFRLRCKEDCAATLWLMNDLSGSLLVVLNRYSANSEAMFYVTKLEESYQDQAEKELLELDDLLTLPAHTWASVEDARIFSLVTSYKDVLVVLEIRFTEETDRYETVVFLLSTYLVNQLEKLEEAGY